MMFLASDPPSWLLARDYFSSRVRMASSRSVVVVPFGRMMIVILLPLPRLKLEALTLVTLYYIGLFCQYQDWP